MRAQSPTLDPTYLSAAQTVLVLCAVAAILNPALLIGAAVGWSITRLLPGAHRARWALALAATAYAATLGGPLVAWPWRLLLAGQLATNGAASLVLHADLTTAITAEALCGLLLYQVATSAAGVIDRGIEAQFRREIKRRDDQREAVHGEPLAADPRPHVPAVIRLGLNREDSKPFDLHPAELEQHVFLPGASGSGKTTTLTRLADGVLGLGYGVVIVDCKGGSLKSVARGLAQRHGVPFACVDPNDPHTLGYDPCSGDASAVTNKLVGVFQYAAAGEIYKLAAMHVLPILVRALLATGEPVTLAALQDALLPAGMRRLAREAPDPWRDRLHELADSKGVVAEGHLGLALRFGALLEGKFGPLFSQAPLHWEDALATPTVTYIALRATASSEDVDLMGRVIAQDLKQVCAARLEALDSGMTPFPVLLIFDEFAALHEAEQIVDLLLQARQALMPTVISTQYLPEAVPIREACLGAGLLIVHRVTSASATELSAQFGTHPAWEQTVQTGEAGATGMGSARMVDLYNVHPNALRDMGRGRAAVRSVMTDRRAIVEVYRTDV